MTLRIPTAVTTTAASVVIVMGLIVTGCSSSTDGSKASKDGGDGLPAVAEKDWVDMTGKASITIDARDNSFNPENITVSPGTKIVFENLGRNPHNVIPVNKSDFDEVPVSKLQPKDSSTVSLKATKGEIPYYCSLHGTPKAGMKGRLRIAEK